MAILSGIVRIGGRTARLEGMDNRSGAQGKTGTDMAEQQKKRVYIVSDEPHHIELVGGLLKKAGYTVSSNLSSEAALEDILKDKPDCVLSDLMMPGLDGLDLLKAARDRKGLARTKFIIVSATAYDFDRKRVFDFGADGFIQKPINPDTFTPRVERVLADTIDMTFWGVRGTLPVSGEKSLKYGGNTSCVSLEFPRGQFFIFDGGSGIKPLGNALMAEHRRRIKATFFISHPHWDHINALPFFAPLYIQGNEFEILGAHQGDLSMVELISAQMAAPYFPITLSEFGARVYFRDLKEGEIEVDGIRVRTKLLSHPGRCLGYRVEYGGRSICYVTDNEMFLKESPYYNWHYLEKLAEFCAGTEVLITDSTYTDEEYKTKEGWGHSCISEVAKLAHNANVKTLYLFHHDPDQNDDAIDDKFRVTGQMLAKMKSKTKCLAPREGQKY